MENIGLVLEGGGMRGVYTAGVLEYFMEKELYFPYVIGVSAGACMAASYLSRQNGRNKVVNIDLVRDPRYLSFRNFIRNREFFGMDFLFDEIPNKINPFDYDTFLNAKEQFIVGTTDCETGEAVYYDKKDHGKHMLKIIRASSSLPFVAPSVEYDNRLLLDGGIIDPIPIRKAQEDGNHKNVIVMTKPPNYTKKPSKFGGAITYFSKKHPKIGELIQSRYKHYNETLGYLDSEKEKGNVMIIQPSVHIPVSRMERKQERLLSLYELGYKDAKKQYEEIVEFLK
ncbi:patatin family protein [Bacillus carboniphilus]|uniref:Patatin family protein n=1 Tax=Bacillus carboniphilus TaxID=86663 RepID=A0ABN0VR62_9BACI